MTCDGILGLDAAKQQHSHVGVHEEDEHQQCPHVVKGWQGDNQGGQQCLETLQESMTQMQQDVGHA